MVLYDKDIREPLFDFLEETYGKIRIIEEKQTGSARADVVMITPEVLYGIEIKSDADTYTRLDKQVENYNSYYDRNIIVVGSSHAHHVKEHVPDWWGIITVEVNDAGEADFYVVRNPEDNPKVKDERKITILWRPELNHLLEKNNLPKYKEKSKLFVQEKLLEKVSGEILWPQAYEELFERDYTTISEKINEYRAEKGQKPRRKKRRKYKK
ncbi:MAG: sce7726 family protein [Lachnospiraceae bacterium]|nr:sce7726 family protein [Lachnospiraceae bacterium]